MRKPAAPVKPFALTASAREGGFSSALTVRFSLAGNTNRQRLDAPHEAGIDPFRRAYHLDPVEALEHLLPDDLQLQFGQPHADAAMDAEAERQVRPRPGTIDDELVGLLDRLFIAIARDVPHHDALALLDLLVPDLGVDQRSAPHVRQRRLPAD